MSELPEHVLGIDPGMETGLFLLNTRTGVSETAEVDFAEYGFWLEQAIKTHRPTVVCESFVITPKTHQTAHDAHWSIEGTGVARFLSWKYGVPFLKQSQSASKNFATDAKLKRLEWYVPGMGHGVDAQRQVLLYLVNNRWWDERLSA